MTIIEAINKTDSLKFNTFTMTEKLAWLSTLDQRIKTKIIDTHEGEAAEFSGYGEDTPLDTELLAEAPYDELYIHWIESQIDYYNGEFKKYNNSRAMFNTAYSEYERHYNRTHKPKSARLKFF